MLVLASQRLFGYCLVSRSGAMSGYKASQPRQCTMILKYHSMDVQYAFVFEEDRSHTLIPITNTTCNSLRIDTFKCMCCSESILSKLSPLVFAEPNNMSSWHWLSVNSHVTFDLKNPKHKVEVKRLFTNILRPSVPDTTTHGQRDRSASALWTTLKTKN